MTRNTEYHTNDRKGTDPAGVRSLSLAAGEGLSCG